MTLLCETIWLTLVFGIVSFLWGMIDHGALPTKTNWAQTFRSAAVGCLSAKLTYSVTACILTKKFLLFTKYDYKNFVYSSYCHGAKLFLCFRFWTRFWTWSHQRMVFGKFFSLIFPYLKPTLLRRFWGFFEDAFFGKLRWSFSYSILLGKFDNLKIKW